MNLFSRAWQNLPLSPGERAFLKLLKGWLFTAIGVGLIAGAQYLTNNQQVNVWALAWITGGAIGLSVLTALDKYFTAQGDLPLSVMTEAVTQRLQSALPGIVAQHIASLPQAQPTSQQRVQPQQAPQPIAMPPAPFAPPVPQVTYSGPQNMTTSSNPQMQQQPFPPSGTVAGNYSGLSFGDTSSVPAVQPPTR